MKIDLNHPFPRSVWWALIALNALFILVLAVMAVAKPFILHGDKEAFDAEADYETSAWDRVEPSLFKFLAQQVSVDREGTFANWVSSLQFAISGFLALLIFSSLPRKRSFVGIGGGLLGLGMRISRLMRGPLFTSPSAPCLSTRAS